MWEITVNEKKAFAFWKTLVVQFNEIEGLDVYLLTGIERDKATTVAVNPIAGENYDLYILNTTWIIVVP